MTSNAAHQKKVPYNVSADFIDQHIECNEVCLPRRHLHNFPILYDRNELVDEDFYLGLIVAKRFEPCEHVGVCGNVVGAQHIDDELKTAPEFFPVVGDIGQTI